MHLLQRVHTSRSIGFSCSHSTSKAPSQPETRSGFPDHTGKLRSAGSSPPVPPVIKTLGVRTPARRPAHSRAAIEGPMVRTWPPDLSSTLGTGSGSGSAAAASSAAIFGVACLPSADQPAISRMLTKRSSALDPAASASSPKSGASCVQPTRSDSSPSAAWNCPASLRHSSVWSVIGLPYFKAAPRASASSGIVLLQLQSLSVLSFIDIVFFSGLGLGFFLFFLFRHQQRLPRVLETRKQLLGNRLRLRVIVDVGVEAVHDVEARIGEQLLQRRALHALLDLRVHERLEVGLEREAVERRQLRRLLLGNWLFRSRLALQPRPAPEKVLLPVAHQPRARSLGDRNDCGLMRFFGSGREVFSTNSPTHPDTAAGIATASTSSPASLPPPPPA